MGEKVVTGIDAAKAEELVEASVHKACAKRGMECTIASVDCLNLTPWIKASAKLPVAAVDNTCPAILHSKPHPA